MMYDSESLTNERIPCRMSAATAPPPSPLSCYSLVLRHRKIDETFLQQIRMAEIEQASLRSEQLSDKSSSPALPDDLSLDEHTAFRLLTQEATVSNTVITSGMGSRIRMNFGLRNISEESTCHLVAIQVTHVAPLFLLI